MRNLSIVRFASMNILGEKLIRRLIPLCISSCGKAFGFCVSTKPPKKRTFLRSVAIPNPTTIKFGLLLLATAAVAFVLLSRSHIAKREPEAIGTQAPPTRVADCSELPTTNGQLPASKPNPPRSFDEILASIRGKLAQLSQIAKSDKGAEDEIITELDALLSDENASKISRELSAEERHSRFGLAALQRWLKVDTLGAADWVAIQKDASDEQAWAAAHELVTHGAALDLYCSRLPNNAWRQIFLKQAALAAMEQDPTKTIQLVRQITPASEQLDLLQTTISTWMSNNPTAASGWIGQIQDSLVKEELIGVGARALASSDPVGAIDWLATSLPVSSDGSELFFNKTLEDILGVWAETEPWKAASFVSQLPSSDLRKTTVNLVWRNWSGRDHAAAANWIKGIEERGTQTNSRKE